MLIVITSAGEDIGCELAFIFCKAFHEASDDFAKASSNANNVAMASSATNTGFSATSQSQCPHKIVLACHSGTDEEVAAKLHRQFGPDYCDFVEFDITKPNEVKQVAARVLSRYGFIDMIVNCAGYRPVDGRSRDAAEIASMFKVNYWGLRNMFTFFVPYMKPRARFVSVASEAAERCWKGLMNETRSKLDAATIDQLDGYAKAFLTGACPVPLEADSVTVSKLLSVLLTRAVARTRLNSCRNRTDRDHDLLIYSVNPTPIGNDGSLAARAINLYRAVIHTPRKELMGSFLQAGKLLEFDPERSPRIREISPLRRNKVFVLAGVFSNIGLAVAKQIVINQPTAILVILAKSDDQARSVCTPLRDVASGCQLDWEEADHLILGSVEKAGASIVRKYGPIHAVCIAPPSSSTPIEKPHVRLSYEHFRMRQFVTTFQDKLMPVSGRILVVLPSTLTAAWTHLTRKNRERLRFLQDNLNDLDAELYKACHHAIQGSSKAIGYPDNYSNTLAIFNCTYLRHFARAYPTSIKIGVVPSDERLYRNYRAPTLKTEDMAEAIYDALVYESVVGLNGCVLDGNHVIDFNPGKQVPQLVPINEVLSCHAEAQLTPHMSMPVDATPVDRIDIVAFPPARRRRLSGADSPRGA